MSPKRPVPLSGSAQPPSPPKDNPSSDPSILSTTIPKKSRGGGRLSLVLTLLGGFLIVVVGGIAFYYTWQDQGGFQGIFSTPTPTPLPSPTPTPTPTPYAHPDGFSLTPPPGWTADTSGALGTKVIFTSPTPDTVLEGSFTPTLTVVVRDTPGRTLEAAVARTKATFLRTLTDYTPSDDSLVSILNGELAHILGGTYRQAQWSLRNKQLVLVKDEKTYTLTGTALASVWESRQYHALFDAALSSLSVSGTPTPLPPTP